MDTSNWTKEQWDAEIENIKATMDEIDRLDDQIRKQRISDRQLQAAATLAVLKLFSAKVKAKRRQVVASISNADDDTAMEAMQSLDALNKAEKAINERILEEQKHKT